MSIREEPVEIDPACQGAAIKYHGFEARLLGPFKQGSDLTAKYIEDLNGEMGSSRKLIAYDS